VRMYEVVYLLADIELEIPAQVSDCLRIRLSMVDYRSRYPVPGALPAQSSVSLCGALRHLPDRDVMTRREAWSIGCDVGGWKKWKYGVSTNCGAYGQAP
jgi:hypothetical protein